MKQAPRLALLTLVLGLVAGCTSTTRQAPVVDRAPPVQTRPAQPRVEEPKPDEKGMYTVRKGDTLLRIALDHGENYRDLVAWNNLRDPDDIKVGQVLRVAEPEGKKTAGVTTQPVPMPPPATQPPRKTAPRADKKPYSETNVAEVQKEAAPRVEPAPPPAPAVAATTGWGVVPSSMPLTVASMPPAPRISCVTDVASPRACSANSPAH